MRRCTMLVAAIVLLSAVASAQRPTKINPATQIVWPAITGNGIPEGSCMNQFYGQPYTDTMHNVEYVCGGNGWFAIGTGTFSTLSGDVVSTPTGGNTTVLGLNGVLLSSLGTGLLKNAAGTGQPSIVTAPNGALVGTTDTQTLTNKTVDGVTPVTMGFLDATSSIQTQLNSKAPAFTVTTIGTSGPATYSANVLNIPQYTASGLSSFTAGNLSPLFTTALGSNPTTAPALTFTLSNAAQGSVLAGPASGGAGTPSYQTAPTINAANMFNFPVLNQNTTGTAANITAASNSSLTTLSALSLPYSQLSGKPTIPTSANWPGAGACAINQYVSALTNGAVPTCAQVTYAQLGGTVPTWDQNTSGNAATATALGTTGINGQYWGVSGGAQGWYTPAGSGTVNSGTAYSPAYYPAGGGAQVSGVTPFSGLAYYSTSSAPTAASAAQIVAAIGSTAVANATNATSATTATTASSATTAGSATTASSVPASGLTGTALPSGITSAPGLTSAAGGALGSGAYATISNYALTSSLGTGAYCTAGTTGSDCLTLSSGLVPVANLPTGTSGAQGAVKLGAAGGADVYGAAAAITLSGLGGVPTTTTVNGHALSSNVTVSASDLSTGTLPHAQLPTLLSGDIPNNAANTSGNAATATALNTTGGSGTYWGVSGTTQGWYTPAGSGTVNSGTAYSPAYYPSGGGTQVSGVTPFTGLAYFSASAPPAQATAGQIVGAIGSTAVTNATNATNATTASALSSYPAAGLVGSNGSGLVAGTAAQLGTLAGLPQYSLVLSGGSSAALTDIVPSATSGLPLVSQGASANPAYAAITLAAHATQAADTMVANMTASSAAPTAVVMPTTAHGVWLAEGASTAPHATAAGAQYYPLVGGGGSADPSFAQLTGAGMASNTVTATQLAAQYSKGACTEVWGGTGTSNVLQSGDDAISNNTCYNDSGVTRTITAIKCRADTASNTTTVNPAFGASGTGTTILSGALTCGSSYAYSSSGTVVSPSWTTGTGIDPIMGGTLTGTSVAMLVEYTF